MSKSVTIFRLSGCMGFPEIHEVLQLVQKVEFVSDNFIQSKNYCMILGFFHIPKLEISVIVTAMYIISF